MSDLSIVEVTSVDVALAELVVSAANIVSHGGYYEVDVYRAAETIARHRASEAERVREACAKVAEERHGKYVEPTVWDYGAQDACVSIAAAIRSLPIGEA